MKWIPEGEHADKLFDAFVANYENFLRQRLANEITEDQFRRKRLELGFYYQLPETSYLFRVKIPGGIIDQPLAHLLADFLEKDGRDLGHITTRQDIQYHWVPIARSAEMVRALYKVGISTIGSCSDGARNITADHYAGVAHDEAFDTTPDAIALTKFYEHNPRNLKLPRKYKIAFSGSAADRCAVTIHCLGYYALIRDGVEGYAVYGGGGLSVSPFAALPVKDFIPRDECLIAGEAMMRLFHEHGDRVSRKKARLRFVARNLGQQKFAELFQQYYAQVDKEMGDELRADMREFLSRWKTPAPALKADARAAPSRAINAAQFARWKEANAYLQKQPGYTSVTIKLVMGDFTTRQLRGLTKIAAQYGNGTLRCTIGQKFVLPWIPEGVLEAVYEQLDALRLADAGAYEISDVVSCPGLDYCSLAVTKSMGLGAKVRKHMLDAGVIDDPKKLGPFRINLSGCPHGCSQHGSADIGATGMMVKDEKGEEHPHYSIFVGGKWGMDGRTATRVYGRYAEAETPEIMASFANDYYQSRRDGEPFHAYVERMGVVHFEKIAKSIQKKHSSI